MTEPLEAGDVQGAGRVAGVDVTGLNLERAAAELQGVLGALRRLPVNREVEPLSTPREHGDGSHG